MSKTFVVVRKRSRSKSRYKKTLADYALISEEKTTKRAESRPQPTVFTKVSYEDRVPIAEQFARDAFGRWYDLKTSAPAPRLTRVQVAANRVLERTRLIIN